MKIETLFWILMTGLNFYMVFFVHWAFVVPTLLSAFLVYRTQKGLDFLG